MLRHGAKLVLLALAAVLIGCGDRTPTDPGSPDRSGVVPVPAPGQSPSRLLSAADLPAECGDSALSHCSVLDMIPQVFRAGSSAQRTADRLWHEMDQAKQQGDAALTQLRMDELINLALQQYYAGRLVGGQSEQTQQRVLRYIYLLYCGNNIRPIPDLSSIFGASNTVLVRPTTPDTVVRGEDTVAAVKIDLGDVPDVVNGQPFFGTYVSVVRTSEPLPTNLDWYGLDGFRAGAFEFITNPVVTFDEPVLAGICLQYDDAIVLSPADLWLAHEVDPSSYTPSPGGILYTSAAGSIELLEPRSTAPLGLSCDQLPLPVIGFTGSARAILGSLLLPPPLSAAGTGGSRGGNVRTFSPFAGVDRVLALSGSAPATDTILAPATSTTVTAQASVRTRHPSAQTPVSGVTVNFAPATSFAPTSATTGTNGGVTSTWTLVGGSNTGTATPSRAGLAFTPAQVTYSANVIVLEEVAIETADPLPEAQEGSPYSLTLTATGGTGSFTWALVGGTLPAGLILSSSGVISGTPTADGTFSFTVQATSGAQTGTSTYQLTVKGQHQYTALRITWVVQPRQTVCKNAIGGPPKVRVVDQSGRPAAGVSVALTAVDNNGHPTMVIPGAPVVTDASGYAAFQGYRVTKTGAIRLVATVTSPVRATAKSDKVNIKPPCY